MDAIAAVVQALGLAVASGLSLYATVAFVGLAGHFGWIGPLPGALGVLGDPWVFGVAGLLALVEALALLVPGIATGWEAVHTAVRPLAAGILAALALWGSPRAAAVAGLLGLALGLATHATKLGLRAAIDTSPEPFTNAAAVGAELSAVAALSAAIWSHPWIALAVALALLAATALMVRAFFRAGRRAFSRLFSSGPRAAGRS
jgi:hypothetical protein